MGKVMSEFGTILSTMGSDIQVSTMPTADALEDLVVLQMPDAE